MPPPPRKELEVILARELAAHVASPMLVVDGAGTLVHLNEAAERLLGVRFAELGEAPLDAWLDRWLPDLTARMTADELPLARAMLEGRPAHDPLPVRVAGGQTRTLEVTAYPLYAKGDPRFVGAVAIFWEPNGG